MIEKKNTSLSVIPILILFLLFLLPITSCSSAQHQDPAEIAELKQQAMAIMAVERTPETVYELIETIDQLYTKDNELHNLREKSQNFLYMYYEHPSPKGILLIPGLGASPNEMRMLAERLDKEGYTVIGVRLPGHGEGLDALEQTTWQQWYDEAEFAFDTLDYLTDETYVLGISTGGSLALLLAKEKEFDGLITIAPAVKMKDWKINFIGLIKHFKRYSERTGLTEEEKITYDEAIPTESIHELKKLIKVEKKALEQVNEPTIIMQATNDPRLKEENAQYVYDNIATEQESKGILWFESDEHVILNGDTKEQVISEIIKFIEG